MKARWVSRLCIVTGVLLTVGGTSVLAVGLATQPASPGLVPRAGAVAQQQPAGVPEQAPATLRLPAREREPAPQVPDVAAPPPVPVPATTAPAAPLSRSEPATLEIPAIGVRTRIFPIGLAEDGTIAVPQPGPRYDSAAWYKYSPTPGELGPSVVEGHLDTPGGEPSVFYRLGELGAGAQVRIARTDGTTAVFQVTEVGRYSKAQFPTSKVYGDLDYPGLRLITCAGGLDSARHYLDNTVIFATLVSTHPTPEEEALLLDEEILAQLGERAGEQPRDVHL